MGRSSSFSRPERLEEQLGLRAGVDEDQRGRGAADQVHHRRRGVVPPVCPAQGGGSSVSSIADVGLGPRIGEQDRAPRRRGSAASAGGSSTVADRPTRRRPGREASAGGRGRASAGRRASISASAWISSTITRASPAEDPRGLLVGQHQRQRFRAWSAGCAAGRRAGARAGAAPVSPVRSSTRIASPISASGAPRLRRMSAASAFSGET